MHTHTTTASAAIILEIITARADWQIEQHPAGIGLSGRTHSGREIAAFIPGATLPEGITSISGGVCAWETDDEETWAVERRAIARAKQALLPISDLNASVTLAFPDKHPSRSSFGVDLLAALGHPMARQIIASHLPGKAWDAALEQLGDLLDPKPETPGDEDDHARTFAPMWATA